METNREEVSRWRLINHPWLLRVDPHGTEKNMLRTIRNDTYISFPSFNVQLTIRQQGKKNVFAQQKHGIAACEYPIDLFLFLLARPRCTDSAGECTGRSLIHVWMSERPERTMRRPRPLLSAHNSLLIIYTLTRVCAMQVNGWKIILSCVREYVIFFLFPSSKVSALLQYSNLFLHWLLIVAYVVDEVSGQ
jgi:hypothetical protein